VTCNIVSRIDVTCNTYWRLIPDELSRSIFCGLTCYCWRIVFVVCDFNVLFATLIARNTLFYGPYPSLHRHTLGQIARLVHIGPARDCGVVSEQL
jgi:hypothetical protein